MYIERTNHKAALQHFSFRNYFNAARSGCGVEDAGFELKRMILTISCFQKGAAEYMEVTKCSGSLRGRT